MRLHLVRHAEANEGSEDSERSLSNQGLKTLEIVRNGIKKLQISVPRIVHSQKLRAKQTAEGLAETLKPGQGIQPIEGLNPMDDPQLAQTKVNQSSSDMMIVGHLPHLSHLASLLLCGDPEMEIIQFHNCTVACMEKPPGSDSWTLVWVLKPNLLNP